MIRFLVTVRIDGCAPISFSDVGTDCCAVCMAAQDRYGACRVFATPV